MIRTQLFYKETESEVKVTVTQKWYSQDVSTCQI